MRSHLTSLCLPHILQEFNESIPEKIRMPSRYSITAENYFIFFPLFVIPLNSGTESMTNHCSFCTEAFEYFESFLQGGLFLTTDDNSGSISLNENIYTRWLYAIKTLSASLALCDGDPSVDTLKGSVIRSIIFSVLVAWEGVAGDLGRHDVNVTTW